jgi:putative endonuclease
MREERQYYVYILSNQDRNIFYLGVTGNMYRRMIEHRRGEIRGFTQRHQLKYLVYIEVTDDVDAALSREKQLKNWHRPWKLNLIRSMNPSMNDLSAGW